MSSRDIRASGLHHMQTGRSSGGSDPLVRVVQERPVEMEDTRLLALLRLRAALRATAAETAEMDRRGFLSVSGRLTVHGQVKLAALREATVTVVPS
jgi:hypothetical protein